MKPTTTHKFKAIQLAVSQGYEINDNIDLDSNYDYACDHISNNVSSSDKIEEIEGEKHEGYMNYELPLFGSCSTNGEIHYNRELSRWENLVQDNDGKLYLAIAE